MTKKFDRKEINRQKRDALSVARDFARPLFDYPREKRTGKPDNTLTTKTAAHLLIEFPDYNWKAMESVAARAVREIRKEWIDNYEPTYKRDTPFGHVELDFDNNDVFFLNITSTARLLKNERVTIEGHDHIMALYRHLGAAIKRMDRVIASKREAREEKRWE